MPWLSCLRSFSLFSSRRQAVEKEEKTLMLISTRDLKLDLSGDEDEHYKTIADKGKSRLFKDKPPYSITRSIFGRRFMLEPYVGQDPDRLELPEKYTRNINEAVYHAEASIDLYLFIFNCSLETLFKKAKKGKFSELFYEASPDCFEVKGANIFIRIDPETIESAKL